MSQPPRRALDRSSYLSEDTIAAMVTAAGGAVSMIRVSGRDAFSAMSRLLGPMVSPIAQEWEPRKLYRAILRDLKGQSIDDSLVVKFEGPKSFTGEDCVEFHVHGGAFTCTRLLENLAQYGVRQALPGEFSFRAVRNGKMNLNQAEALSDLIGAANENAVSLALEKMAGAQSQLIRELAEELRNLVTLGEVGIDFADQDVDEVSLANLKKKLDGPLGKLEKLRGSFKRGLRVQEGISVAFIGLPNAGKSSFFNALLGEDRSIVSDIAGTTRDVIREKLTLSGKSSSVTLRLEDTAGLRASEDHVEKLGIDRTEKSAQGADLVLLVVDASAPIDSLRELLHAWNRLGCPNQRAIGILTKCDLAKTSSLEELIAKLDVFQVGKWLQTSAATGSGVTEAGEAIADFCENWVHRERGEVLLTRLDHVQAVAEAIEHLNRSKTANEIDLFASDLRQALNALGILIGETVPDDILGRIFSKFCIGK